MFSNVHFVGVFLSVAVSVSIIARAQDKLDPELERLIGNWVVEQLEYIDPPPNDWLPGLAAMIPWPVQIDRKGPNLNGCYMRLLAYRDMLPLDLEPPKAGEFSMLKGELLPKVSAIVLSRSSDLDAEQPALRPQGNWIMFASYFNQQGINGIFPEIDALRELPAIQITIDSLARFKFSTNGLESTPSLLGGAVTPEMKFVPARNFPTLVKSLPGLGPNPSVAFSYLFNERAGILWRSSGDLCLFVNQEIATPLLPAMLAWATKQEEDKRKAIEEATRIRERKELTKRQQRAQEAWRIAQIRLREGRIEDARSALETIITKLSDTTVAPKAKEALDKLTPVPAKAER